MAATLRYCYCRPGGILGYFPSGKAAEAVCGRKESECKKTNDGLQKKNVMRRDQSACGERKPYSRREGRMTDGKGGERVKSEKGEREGGWEKEGIDGRDGDVAVGSTYLPVSTCPYLLALGR